MKVLFDKLIVREITEVERDGFILPESTNNEFKKGCVVAVGDEMKATEVGDEVLFPSYAGVKFKVDEDLLLLKETEIIIICNK